MNLITVNNEVAAVLVDPTQLQQEVSTFKGKPTQIGATKNPDELIELRAVAAKQLPGGAGQIEIGDVLFVRREGVAAARRVYMPNKDRAVVHLVQLSEIVFFGV